MAWLKIPEALTKLPGLLFRGRFAFTFDEVPFVAEKLTLAQKRNLLTAGLDEILRRERARALPPTLQIEPTNLCTLKCPLCPTGSGSMKRPPGFMSRETFARIMDELGDTLLCVFLYGWGEPFLHRELLPMIKMCTNRNIRTEVPTNGQHIQTPQEALQVVDSGLTALLIALDGTTQEIYQTYRKSGDVEKVKRFTALIEEAKARRGVPYPYTNLRFIITRDNEDDLSQGKRLARELGVNMFSYRSLGMLSHSDKFRDFEPARKNMRRYEYEGTNRRSRPPFQCRFPFRQPTIFWDGTVVGCEYDYDLERPWGRIGERPFREIWNSPRAIEHRRQVRSGPDRPRFCGLCPYQDRTVDRCVLAVEELRPLA